jgi:hypothetical protein
MGAVASRAGGRVEVVSLLAHTAMSIEHVIAAANLAVAHDPGITKLRPSSASVTGASLAVNPSASQLRERCCSPRTTGHGQGLARFQQMRQLPAWIANAH